MQVAFQCARCAAANRQDVSPASERVACASCDWCRELGPEDFTPGESASGEAVPARCLVCGCDDLWRQKDFPPQLGLGLVAAGAILSTIAWSQYEPVLAIGILMAFALVDLLLYTWMPDVLVCYRCEARHRKGGFGEEHPAFNLETAERYRQQALRMAEHAERGN